MNIISNPTIITPAESVMQRVSEKSSAALTQLKAAAIFAFHELWIDEASIPAKLAIMGNLAVANFEQHARTVEFLLMSGVELEPVDYTPPHVYTPHEDGTITIGTSEPAP